ncbi:MAG TPA: protein kinase [Dehalococcoidia bacterium]|nr:protein kinase [Dehalococcoidia bacterium]
MPSERVQRQIDHHLDAAEVAGGQLDWTSAREHAEAALALDSENADARVLLAAALRRLGSSLTPVDSARSAPVPAQPTAFANGRYAVKRFLGEGGKKKVYLAHDSLLDRDVAFALIKTEGLDDAGRVRIQREAQAMGRLGNHPNIVTVYDIGDENGQPYLVLPILSGGDVEGVIERAPEHKLPLEQALRIAIETCQGLELAHSKGIVHRDLKPGNVWLTEDGRAMIGDFGLAVAADRSRLTQAGMMVGTVSYMPPEQAMGGEVGPRSDLYSLGAMLYEMVCGRPPFVGDESVAIIGQHLNTPPVAPTWHRPDCPLALEALILRLLEKDPNKRPSNATEVREALSSVTSIPRAATVIEAVTSAEAHDPLYRRTFVGRENEVKQLQQAFDGAMSGNGALVMVVGEPGIGKTALCEQLATYVALRGGKALVGHSYEEGSLSLPYLAFVEAMRSYVLARDPDGLRSDLGTGAADVARIVSEVRDRVQGVELRPAGDPEDDRWRLLQAITGFLRNASSVQPLVIVLEDLHWADRGTLDLLLHVARNLQGARVLIVGNYRDVEVDRTHQLSGVLADLRRIGSFANVRLRGLTVDEVHRMYEAIRGNAVPWGQAEAVFRATEGNPLFVQEVLRYLVEEGIVVREGGRYVAQQGEGVGIPEGLRDVVGKRLNRLGEKTNQVLSIAAVIGRDFRLDVLQAVTNLPEEDVIQALEEASERSVVEQRQGFAGQLAFRFTHAFFRQTLYEELFAARRIRVHQQVARALEAAYGRRVEEHASELAEHYANSSDSADLAKSVQYSETAARRALSVFAYGEAVRHLEQALKAQEVLDPDDKIKRCDLLLSLAEALTPAGESRRAADEAAPLAFSLAESLDDRARCFAASNLALNAVSAYGIGPSALTPEFQLWAERMDRYAEPETADRVRADQALSRMQLQKGGLLDRSVQVAAVALQQRALDLARRLNDRAAMFKCAQMLILHFPDIEDQTARLQLAEEVVNWPREGISTIDLVTAIWFSASVLLSSGQRGKAEALWRDVAEIAGRTRDPTARRKTMETEILLSILNGELERAAGAIDQMLEQGVELGQEGAVVNQQRLYSPRLISYLGRSDLYRPDLPGPRALGSTPALLHLGRLEEAQATLTSEPLERLEAAPFLLPRLELALASGDRETVERVAARLEGAAHLLGIWYWDPTCYARHLGAAWAFLGKPGEARSYYRQALLVCEKVRFRPELALTRLSLAELLLEHYPDEHDAAIEHLDFAIAELRDMKMQPALERALRHRGLLKA